jgi:hypothetical protein
MAKRTLIRAFLLCAAIAVLAVLGGCGGGGDDSSSTVASGGEGTGATTTGEAGGSSGKSGSDGGSSGKSGDQTGGSSGNGTTPPGKSGGSSGNGTTPPGKSGGKSGGSGGKSGKKGKSGKQGKSGKKGGSPSGSSGSPSGTAPTPSGGSKAEFVSQVNAICKKTREQSLANMAAYAKEHKSGSGQPSPALLMEAVKATFVPGLRAEIGEIRALGAPPGDEATVEAFLAALEENIEAASGSGSPAEFGKSFTRSAQLAHDYGIDSCAYG